MHAPAHARPHARQLEKVRRMSRSVVRVDVRHHLSLRLNFALPWNVVCTGSLHDSVYCQNCQNFSCTVVAMSSIIKKKKGQHL